NAFGRVGIALLCGLPVDTGFQILRFLRMTLRALSGHQFFGGAEFMHAAMTRSAGRFAEDGVGAVGESLGLVRVAGGAFHFGDFGGMRKFFDGGVAVLAAENCVGTVGMLGGVNRNALPGVRF